MEHNSQPELPPEQPPDTPPEKSTDRSFMLVIAISLIGALVIGAIIVANLVDSDDSPEATAEVAAEATAEVTEEATEQADTEATEATEEAAEQAGSGEAGPDDTQQGGATPTSLSRVNSSILLGTEATMPPRVPADVTEPAGSGGASAGQPTPTSLSRVTQSIILQAAEATPEATAETTEEATAEATEETTPEGEAEATEQAGDGQTGEHVSVDQENQTVTINIIASLDDTNGGLNFNGDATVTVPTGWTVNVTFENRSDLPHSAMVVSQDAVDQNNIGSPVFGGAATSDPNGGTTESEEFSFTAGEEGEYALACGVPGHAAQGHWINFVVGSSDVEPSFERNGG